MPLWALGPIACGGSNGDGGGAGAGGNTGGSAGQTGTGGLAGAGGQSGDGGVPFGGTLAMSMHTTEGLADYQASYDRGVQAGVNGAQLILPWAAFEPTVGSYNLALLDWDALGLAALEGRNVEVLLTFSSVDIMAPTTPSDLNGVAFDDPTFITAYENAVDQLFLNLSFAADIKYFSVGNEVDTYLKGQPQEWPAYGSFVTAVVDHMHSKHPGVKVGITITSPSALVSHRTEVQSLNAATDVLILNHYGKTEPGFAVTPPEQVATDLAAMVDLAAGKPLVIQEIGYPSSALLGSSDAKQAEFVQHLFEAWKTQGSDKIPFLSYFKQKDWPATYCNKEACAADVDANGICNPSSNPPLEEARKNFIAFLCSLGLIDDTKQPKAGWTAFQQSASTLGF